MLTGPLQVSELRSSAAPRRRCREPDGRAGAVAAPPAHGDAGIGGGSTAFLSRALTRSRPPPRPKPSSASAVQAPHCRCPPCALRSAETRGSPRPPSSGHAFAAPKGPLTEPTRGATRAKPQPQRGGGDSGGRWLHRSPGRSRMRQDKLTGSLRRGGRCLKRQGGAGGGGGGVGTILSNVLKKRSCISRTAPRLLCTLEPGEEDPGLQMGHWKVAWRRCLRWTPLRPGSAREPLGAGHRGLAPAALGRPGRAERRPGPRLGQRPPRRGGPAALVGCSRAPPRGLRAVQPCLCRGSAGTCPGSQRPRNQLGSSVTRRRKAQVCYLGSERKAAAAKEKSDELC